ncbi:hypothetical protein L6452_02220 [Arctium lappa]|uniref:Uncharacterized protein n=1 Tax=Arctium lappa TaxID=4217 RepID=A0ACB9FJ04_ARCLA|nr:hypothetical protein L6452_02220 [Arctium lappa]
MSEMRCFWSSTLTHTLKQILAYQLKEFEKTQSIKVVGLCFSNSAQLDSCKSELRVKSCARVSETAQCCQKIRKFQASGTWLIATYGPSTSDTHPLVYLWSSVLVTDFTFACSGHPQRLCNLPLMCIFFPSFYTLTENFCISTGSGQPYRGSAQTASVHNLYQPLRIASRSNSSFVQQLCTDFDADSDQSSH